MTFELHFALARLGPSALALALIIASPARGQRVPPPVRALFGDVAVILRPEIDGTLAIGVAGTSRAVSLTVRATDARRWADSAVRLVVPLPARPARRSAGARRATPGRRAPGRDGSKDSAASTLSDSSRRARVILEEPGVGVGTLSLTRVDSAGERRFILFVDDAELSPIRQVLVVDEARTLVRLIRNAATPASSRRGRAAPRRPSRPSARPTARP